MSQGQKCTICGAEIESRELFEEHKAMHRNTPDLQLIRVDPLSYLILLPDGVTTGRFEAAKAFMETYAILLRQNPRNSFQLLPFSYQTEGEGGQHPALKAILAVSI